MHKNILPANHSSTIRVKAVVDRILLANWEIKEMKDKNWGVAVIDSSEENAFVLPVSVFVVLNAMQLCIFMFFIAVKM